MRANQAEPLESSSLALLVSAANPKAHATKTHGRHARPLPTQLSLIHPCLSNSREGRRLSPIYIVPSRRTPTSITGEWLMGIRRRGFRRATSSTGASKLVRYG